MQMEKKVGEEENILKINSSQISNSNGHHVHNDIKEEEEMEEIKEIKEKEEEPKMNGNGGGGGDDRLRIITPHSQLPKPEAPPGLTPKTMRARSLSESSFNVGKFLRDRSYSFSAAIAKRISTIKENVDNDAWSEVDKSDDDHHSVTEINISGLKVIVKNNSRNNNVDDKEEVKGRISFFSRSICRDCTAVRSFFRERGLKFVEINIDVYPKREKELIQRTGSCQVPQIFFNDKLFGGLVALNSLRNSGCFDERFKQMLMIKCSTDAPAPPVYGFDDYDEESVDEIVGIVRLLRQRLPIQDRLMKMKIVKNCFAGSELVELLIQRLDCGRKKVVEIGKQMSRRHFIHHVFGENEFEDGKHYYRFLEHEPFIHKCYNFRGCTNDSEPKPAVVVGRTLTKIMAAILEAYATDDRSHVDYAAVKKSEEFRRYVNVARDLQRVNLLELSPDEKLAFFLNLHNAMVIHAIIRLGLPEGVVDRRSFYSDFQYLVGGYPFSINAIRYGILRRNQRGLYALVKPFSVGDKRLELAVHKVNPLIHFGMCNGTRSSPIVRFFTPQGIEAELRYATREFFQKGGVEVNLDKRTVYLTRIMKWYSADFGQEKEILKWMITYLDATKAGLLTHILNDGAPVNIVYQNYDWKVNSFSPIM